jgi:hypothetical protein
LRKFHLFISIYNEFQFLFVDRTKAFAILIGRKSFCRLGSIFKEAKDVVAYLTIGFKG